MLCGLSIEPRRVQLVYTGILRVLIQLLLQGSPLGVAVRDEAENLVLTVAQVSCTPKSPSSYAVLIHRTPKRLLA